MKRSLILALALALSGVASFASVATATGSCTVASVTLYSGAGTTGTSRTFCYNVSDPDISSETSTVMGPLSDGTFKSDFDSSASTSGVSSISFYDAIGGSNVSVCIYQNKNASGLMTSIHNSGTVTYGVGSSLDNIAESVTFTSQGVCL